MQNIHCPHFYIWLAPTCKAHPLSPCLKLFLRGIYLLIAGNTELFLPMKYWSIHVTQTSQYYWMEVRRTTPSTSTTEYNSTQRNRKNMQKIRSASEGATHQFYSRDSSFKYVVVEIFGDGVHGNVVAPSPKLGDVQQKKREV